MKRQYVQPVYTADTLRKLFFSKGGKLPLYDYQQVYRVLQDKHRRLAPDGEALVEHELVQLPPLPAVGLDLTQQPPVPSDHDYRELAKLVADRRPLAALNAHSIARGVCNLILVDYVLPIIGVRSDDYVQLRNVAHLPWALLPLRYAHSVSREDPDVHLRPNLSWWMYFLPPEDGKRYTIHLPISFPKWVRAYLLPEQRAKDPLCREYLVPEYHLYLVVNTEALFERVFNAVNSAWSYLYMLYHTLPVEDMQLS